MCASDRRPGRCARAAGGRAAAQRGLSMVEILVGVVVSLLVGLAAAGSASMFTASQRQGVGVGGATVNAGSALAAIKADAATAGLGFFGDSAFLCHRLSLSSGATVLMNGTSFAPALVTADGTNSRLDLLYATNVDGGANVLLRNASVGGSAVTMSLLPAQVGQAVLLAPATAGNTCVVRSVTAVTAATPDTPQTLTFGAAGTHNGAAFAATPSFAERDRVALLGALRWSRYRVDAGRLLLERPLSGDSAVLLRDVVAFRVQYGVVGPNAGDSALTGWVDASGATWGAVGGAAVDRVRALRIGLVTRSPQRDKPDAAGNCSASAAQPVLFGTTVAPDVADWRCWRFRTTVVVVPLRNVSW